MIKKFIKNQIKKTGTVRELEMKNKNLKSQINDLNKSNQQFENKINVLNLDNQQLLLKLKEKSELAGFSLKTNLRGISAYEGKIPVIKYIVENVKKNSKILDVGFGAGAYGKLLRAFYYENIDGLDVYGENINEMGLHLIYDNIYIENIMDFNFKYYDLIIMGDILEHIELDSAKKLLLTFIEKSKCGQMIISVPYEYEQDELYGNYHEKHLQPHINKEYMEKHYPYLNLLSQEIILSSGHIISTYFWKKED